MNTADMADERCLFLRAERNASLITRAVLAHARASFSPEYDAGPAEKRQRDDQAEQLKILRLTTNSNFVGCSTSGFAIPAHSEAVLGGSLNHHSVNTRSKVLTRAAFPDQRHGVHVADHSVALDWLISHGSKPPSKAVGHFRKDRPHSTLVPIDRSMTTRY
jgi:hypothetical protein